MRAFGTGEDSLQLQIDSYGDFHDLMVSVAGKVVPARSPANPTLLVRLTPDAAPREMASYVQELAGGGHGAVFTMGYGPYFDSSTLTPDERFSMARRLRQDRPDFERLTEGMTLTFANGQVIELQTGKMDAPLNALRACVRSLHKSWGLDPAVQENLTREPNLSRAAMQAAVQSLPYEMLRKDVDTIVPVRILVDDQGKPTECVLPVETDSRQFRVRLCKALSRRFAPALDAAGQPVASALVTQIIFKMRN